MSEPVRIGDAELWLGDSREILPMLPKVDAVITDPPYGLKENRDKVLSRAHAAAAKDYGDFDWDMQKPSPGFISEILRAGKWVCIFGGNYFCLPSSPCWLVWDKLNSGDFADCELAWTNWPKAVRRIQWRWNGFCRWGNDDRVHPTQKPLEVMRWAIDLCPKSGTVLDPFMGSGTTGVAQAMRRKRFIGIEKDQRYFDIACRRIEQAYAQRPLFDAAPQAKPEQLDLEAQCNPF